MGDYEEEQLHDIDSGTPRSGSPIGTRRPQLTHSKAAHRPRAQAPPRLAVHAAMALRTALLRAADRLQPAPLALLEHAHHFVLAHLLASFAELGIADHLDDGPKDAEELASLTDCKAEALHRALRAAAVFGVVRLDRHGRFHATRLTKPLRSKDPGAAGDWCRVIGSSAHQNAWTGLTSSLRTGRSAFRTVHGMSFFQWFDKHPEEGHRFAAGIGGLTLMEAPLLVAAYPFPDDGVICDVGGGTGVLLAEILRQRPRLRGVLVETPSVLEEAATYLGSVGVADRVELVEGDLFGTVSATADIYLLKWVLHDWDDRTCEAIVKVVAATMPTGAKLIVIEGVQEQNTVHPRFSMIDLQMLVATEGGRERSVEQLEQLVARAGLRVGTSRRTATDLVLTEATKPAPT